MLGKFKEKAISIDMVSNILTTIFEIFSLGNSFFLGKTCDLSYLLPGYSRYSKQHDDFPKNIDFCFEILKVMSMSVPKFTRHATRMTMESNNEVT